MKKFIYTTILLSSVSTFAEDFKDTFQPKIQSVTFLPIQNLSSCQDYLTKEAELKSKVLSHFSQLESKNNLLINKDKDLKVIFELLGKYIKINSKSEFFYNQGASNCSDISQLYITYYTKVSSILDLLDVNLRDYTLCQPNCFKKLNDELAIIKDKITDLDPYVKQIDTQLNTYNQLNQSRALDKLVEVSRSCLGDKIQVKIDESNAFLPSVEKAINNSKWITDKDKLLGSINKTKEMYSAYKPMTCPQLSNIKHKGSVIANANVNYTNGDIDYGKYVVYTSDSISYRAAYMKAIYDNIEDINNNKFRLIASTKCTNEEDCNKLLTNILFERNDKIKYIYLNKLNAEFAKFNIKTN